MEQAPLGFSEHGIQHAPQGIGQHGQIENHGPQGIGQHGQIQNHGPQGIGQHGQIQNHGPQGIGQHGQIDNHAPQGIGQHGQIHNHDPQGLGQHGQIHNHDPQGLGHHGGHEPYQPHHGPQGIAQQQKTFQVFVNNFDNSRTYTLSVTNSTTVEKFKTMIREKLPGGIPNEQLILTFAGKNLINGTLADYNIQANSTIHLTGKLRGG